MSNPQQKKEHHLFTLDLLVEASSEKEAMQKAATILNHEAVADYKIISGIKVGKLVQEAKAVLKEAQATNARNKTATPVAKPQHPVARATESKPEPVNNDRQISELIQHFRANNTLVRLSILKGLGVRESIPCRILNHDESSGLLTVYHVDEKRVYTVKVNEIDDFGIS